jgi:hypothetical protein
MLNPLSSVPSCELFTTENTENTEKIPVGFLSVVSVFSVVNHQNNHGTIDRVNASMSAYFTVTWCRSQMDAVA